MMVDWFVVLFMFFLTGTDTGGSVRVPTTYRGIFGFRPSHYTTSTRNVIPMTQSFDTVGKRTSTFIIDQISFMR